MAKLSCILLLAILAISMVAALIMAKETRYNKASYGPGRLKSYQCGLQCSSGCSRTQYRKPCLFLCYKCCAKCKVPMCSWQGGPKCP